MNRFQSPADFAAFLRGRMPQVAGAMHVGLDHAGELVETSAKARIGYGQPGWAPLSEATVADRAKKGFSPDEPLYRTGKLRESIHHEVHGNSVTVSSSDPKAAWQEFGTSRIPPRPFIGAAMAETLPQAVQAAVRPIINALEGKPLPSMPKK